MENSFSRIITLLRNERKLTQKQASAELGISQALLSHYERGIRECGLDFLCKAADYYGVSTDYLLGRTDDRNGAQICFDDIPEIDSNSSDKKYRGSVSGILNKRFILNTINLLFDLLQRAECTALTSEVSAYLMVAVYKMFRVVYQVNPKNPRTIFAVADYLARGESNAALELTESRIEYIASGHDFDGMQGISEPSNIILNDELITKQYPQIASSLHTLIRTAESRTPSAKLQSSNKKK